MLEYLIIIIFAAGKCNRFVFRGRGGGREMGKRLAALLSALLFLAFAAFTAASDVNFAPAGAAGLSPEAEADQAEIMAGRDDPNLAPMELLPGELVDINTADAERLELLPGIGSALARAIIDYREANGPFEDAEELMLVPGIGRGRFDALRDRVAIGDA